MDRLREWYGAQDAGPLVVTGVGGIGKSALLAQFALAIPLTTPVLWLDFDRADIAPDDALSVIGAMAEQVALQYDWTDLPELGSKSISAYIDGFGRALARVLPVTTRPLVVLDGFEVAQHVVRHDELWQVLDALLVHVPAARVVVSGRAPVGPLTLGGHSAQRLHLDGIGADAARAWLTESGVTDPDIVQRVVQASHGIPLILKLAVRLHRAGGDDELRDELPKKLVEGFLYRRILDRVLDPSLRLLASDVLVVRWLTVDMLAALFQDSLPRGVEPTAAFTRLSRELALVEHVSNAQIRNPRTDAAAEDVGPLRLRQEVRSATLQLLETEHRERVREIDRRAAEWYASSAASNRIAAAELVYHRLRLGDVEGAAAVWRDEHAPLMLDAVDDMPESEPDAGAWLADRLASAESTDPISRWETDAMARIHSALNRGLPRAVEKVLSEREERTAASPLIVYDAWTRLRRDDASGARGLLADATRPSGTIARDRSVLQALLARAEGDSAAADRLLASLEDEAAWADQIDAESTVLCVRSARIRLSVDIAHELDLTELLRMSNVAERLRDEVQSYLPPSDVTVPALAGHLRQTTQLRSRDWASVDNNVMKIETHGNYLSAMSLDEDPQGLSASIDNIRQSQVHGQLPAALRIDSAVGDAWTPQELELDPSNNASVLSDDETDETILRVREIGIALATLGRQRWRLTIGGVSSRLGGYRTFVAQACALAVRASLRKNDALHLSIVATLAALHEAPLSAAPDHSFRSLDEIIIDALSSTSQVAVSTSSADVALAHRVVSAHQPASSPDAPHGDRSVGEWLDAQRWDKGEADWRALASKGIGAPGESRVESEAARSHVPLIALLLFILGPDPLELLCRRVLGIPDDLPV